jgi:hypothetical protein
MARFLPTKERNRSLIFSFGDLMVIEGYPVLVKRQLNARHPFSHSSQAFSIPKGKHIYNLLIKKKVLNF